MKMKWRTGLRDPPIGLGAMEMHLKRKHDATIELGIPLTLIDTVIEHDDGSVEFPALDMLLATAAVARVLDPIKLVGAELRFLRHVLGYTGTAFAEAIGLSEKTVVSRWENDKTRIGNYTEKVIRQLILNLLGDRAPGIDIGKNAIPSMRILMREASEEPIPLVFRFEKCAYRDCRHQVRDAMPEQLFVKEIA